MKISKRTQKMLYDRMQYDESLKKLEGKAVIGCHGGMGGTTIRDLERGQNELVLVGILKEIWERDDNGFNFRMYEHIHFRAIDKTKMESGYISNYYLDIKDMGQRFYAPGNYQEMVPYSPKNLEIRLKHLGYNKECIEHAYEVIDFLKDKIIKNRKK